MQIKATLKPLLLGIFLLLAASSVVLAQDNSLTCELSEIDVFHPPDSNMMPLYNEWHYFNVIDEEQNISIICTLKLNGATASDLSGAEVLLGYYIDGTPDSFFGGYPLKDAEYSPQKPDVRINKSMVKLTPQGYCVHIESDEGLKVFDALFKPEVDPAPLFSADDFSNLYKGEVINWMVASSKMSVDGELTVGEETYTLKNARGYHDHNWGYWAWGDDIGWDWGQVTQTGSGLNGNDVGGYSLSFGNITDADHKKSTNSVLNVWKNTEIIANFTGEEIEINHLAPIPNKAIPIPPTYEYIIPEGSFPPPMKTSIFASSESDYLDITFDLQRFVPLPVAVPMSDNSGIPITDKNGIPLIKYRVIWEMIGTYQVNGIIDGKPISYTADGFMEYVAGEAIPPESSSRTDELLTDK